jgi:hypothetical protein
MVARLSYLNTTSDGGFGGGPGSAEQLDDGVQCGDEVAAVRGAAAGGAAVRGAAAAGSHVGGAHVGDAAARVSAGGGSAVGGAVASGVQNPVAMSEKLADRGVLVPVVPPGAVPGSPGPDTVIPTAAINAAAAMRMPGRRYHGGGGSA